MSDIVFLRNLRVLGKHGVYDHERRVEQEFLIDIEAEVNTNAAGLSDKLSDSIDYVHLKSIAEEIVRGASFYLVEKIAHEIATRVLKDERVLSVRINICKPTVLANGLPGVSIIRRQTYESTSNQDKTV